MENKEGKDRDIPKREKEKEKEKSASLANSNSFWSCLYIIIYIKKNTYFTL